MSSQTGAEAEQQRHRQSLVGSYLGTGEIALHIEFLGDDFPGETPAGAAEMVARFRAALNIRFQGSAPPKVLFTDRPGKILKFQVGSE